MRLWINKCCVYYTEQQLADLVILYKRLITLLSSVLSLSQVVQWVKQRHVMFALPALICEREVQRMSWADVHKVALHLIAALPFRPLRIYKRVLSANTTTAAFIQLLVLPKCNHIVCQYVSPPNPKCWWPLLINRWVNYFFERLCNVYRISEAKNYKLY